MGEAAFQSLCANDILTENDQKALRPLLAKGLIVEGTSGTTLPLVIALDRQSSVPDAGSIAECSHGIIMRVVLAQIASAFALRCRSFAAIIQSIERRKSSVRNRAVDRENEKFAEIRGAFAATNLLFRPANRCLARSLAFLSVCHAYGLYPSIVFGVRTNPFVAHCWVQIGNHIVHDDSGEAPLYTPILVV
ncbi:MAG TPA: lasso peptide biosynthesis B2 protein [Sphingobium sp.]|uniref:lasso peptide biosynthesis B2 protein n=1 Tax=Sphingobium sp. TaxID=1912891 RepID=UPI002ED22CBF